MMNINISRLYGYTCPVDDKYDSMWDKWTEAMVKDPKVDDVMPLGEYVLEKTMRIMMMGDYKPIEVTDGMLVFGMQCAMYKSVFNTLDNVEIWKGDSEPTIPTIFR